MKYSRLILAHGDFADTNRRITGPYSWMPARSRGPGLCGTPQRCILADDSPIVAGNGLPEASDDAQQRRNREVGRWLCA